MTSVSAGRRCGCPCWHAVCVVGLFGLYAVAPAQAKLGDTLPQLIKRFGQQYTEEGTEQEGNLKYKFRSATYSVDAMMSRRGDNLVSNVEIYYSDKPLQANGEPPISIVRGIMNVTAPRAKWRETPPVGTQQAAFITADGVYAAAILPPDKFVDAGATFTVAVGRVRDVSTVKVNEHRSSDADARAAEQTGGLTTVDDTHPSMGNGTSSQVDDSLAVTLPTGKIVHFKTMEEKANYEAAIGMADGNATPATVAESPQPLMVMEQPAGDGTRPIPLSDGNVAIRALAEAQAYENNEIAADQRFKGQRVPVYGVINSFGVDILGYPFVVIDRAENSIVGVQCTFGKSDAAALATLQKGQIIAVIGTHNGKLFNVQLGGCSLIPWKKPEEKSPLVRHAVGVPHGKH